MIPTVRTRVITTCYLVKAVTIFYPCSKQSKKVGPLTFFSFVKMFKLFKDDLSCNVSSNRGGTQNVCVERWQFHLLNHKIFF